MTADPLLSGRVPTQRSNRSQLLRLQPISWVPGRSNQQLQLTGNARGYNVVVGSSLTARGQPAIEPIDAGARFGHIGPSSLGSIDIGLVGPTCAVSIYRKPLARG